MWVGMWVMKEGIKKRKSGKRQVKGADTNEKREKERKRKETSQLIFILVSWME